MTAVTLNTMLDMAIESIRRHKEARVAEAAREGADEDALTALTAIEVYRGAALVSLILMPPGRDQQLAIARVAAGAFSADMLSMCFETWSTHLKCNPVTNRRWGPNEMQDVAVNHGGRAKGWVTDQLMVCVVNRAGDIAQTGLPYRVVGDTVRWDETRAKLLRDGMTGFTGYVPDMLVEMMKKPSVDVAMYRYLSQRGLTNRDFGIDDEHVRDHMDCAGVKYLVRLASEMGTQVGVTLAAESGSARQKIIDQSLQGDDVLSATWHGVGGDS